MTFHIITLFPQMFEGVFASSIVKRAQDQNKIKINLLNLRDFGQGKHQAVDDKPYGGGAGMVLKPDVLAQAVKSMKISNLPASRGKKLKIILTSPSGKLHTQSKAQELSQLDDLIIICGHYEGVDQRFIDKYVDEEISIGDFILTGGEIPAMVIVDSITRLLPGVLKKPEATLNESFTMNYELRTQNLLEHPHYTRPEVFERKKVPQVLLSGNHRQIAEWRHQKSLSKTKKVRPDLLS